MFLESDLRNLTSYGTSAALYDFQKVKDVSHRKEVKEMMSMKDKVYKIYDDCVEQQKEEFGPNTKTTSLNLIYLRRRQREKNKELELSTDDETSPYSYFNRLIDREEIDKFSKASIVGGYVRNELFQTDYKTDIDVVIGSSLTENFIKLLYKEEKDKYTDVSYYNFLDNTMHLINNSLTISKLDDEKAENLKYKYAITIGESSYVNKNLELTHVFVNPAEFDFTVNCGNISSTDGWLYAPPVTLYDIEHKILRPTLQISPDNFLLGSLRQSTVIRAIRFTLKYDMHMHNSMYIIVKAFLQLQKERKSVDDAQMLTCLRHLYDDPKPLRDEIYSTLRSMGMYETEKYSTFDDYFNYIKNNLNNKDYKKFGSCRINKIITNSGSFMY